MAEDRGPRPLGRFLFTGGALLALAVLAGLTLGGASPAKAALPGENGKIVCQGVEQTAGQPRTQDFEIFTINPDGSGRTNVTNNGPLLDPADPTSFVDEFDPIFSPDSSQITFESYRTGQSEIWTMNADGSGTPRRLTTAPGEDRPGSYSPDGRQIVFHSTRDGNNDFEIYVMNADGSDQRRLTNRTGQDSNPSWSPDGRRIAFHSIRNPGEPGNADPAGTPSDLEIYTIDTSGGDIRRVTNRPGIDAFPQWSPDGRLVFRRNLSAAESGASANSEVFVTNADGSNPINLTNTSNDDPATTNINEASEDHPIWSPDGTRIVFDSNRSGDTEVYTMDARNGSDVRRLTNKPGSDGRCDWGRIVRPAAVTPAPPPVQPAPVQPAAFEGCPASTANVIRGASAANAITGTPGGDRIFGGTGNDVVDALAGNDCVDLGTGDDRGQGGLGNDLLIAGNGKDRVSGSSGSDRMNGNPGDDRLDGGRDNDSIFGDAGNDTLLGSFGNDRLHGVSGKDRISGSRGRDRINGGAGNDRIAGGSSADKIAGDAGHDRINGNSGNDRIKGNSGNDRITSRDSSRDRVNCGLGRDSVVADRKDVVSRNCERVRRR